MLKEEDKTPEVGSDASETSRLYYSLRPSLEHEGTTPIARWVNKKETTDKIPIIGSDSSKPFNNLQFSSAPRYFFDLKPRRHPKRLKDAYRADGHTTWLISERLKNIFEQIDSAGFVFMKVEVDYSNFPEPGQDYWFMYMIRELDCVDEERSEILYQKGIAWKNYLGLLDVKMRPEAVGNAHAFRLKYARMELIVDDILVNAIRMPNIIGLVFDPIQIDSKDHLAFNELAWTRATCGQPELRDGKKAVMYATKACQVTEWKYLNYFDTLAAAYAECGDFDNAVKWVIKSLDDLALAEKYRAFSEQRLALYREQKPYRQSLHSPWTKRPSPEELVPLNNIRSPRA